MAEQEVPHHGELVGRLLLVPVRDLDAGAAADAAADAATVVDDHSNTATHPAAVASVRRSGWS